MKLFIDTLIFVDVLRSEQVESSKSLFKSQIMMEDRFKYKYRKRQIDCVMTHEIDRYT